MSSVTVSTSVCGDSKPLARHLGIEHPYQRASRHAARRRRRDARARRPPDVPAGARRQVLLRDAAEVAAQEALRELAPGTAGTRRAGDALDQREARGGDAAQQLTVFRGNLRVHGGARLYMPGARAYNVAMR